MIEVSLLGPPRVERDGVLVAFDTRKAVALLAHLALTDRPRPRDTLADLLWPDTDPDRARGALRRTLSSLRTAVGAERVEATRDHVRLVKDPGMVVDVDRFRDLLDRGTRTPSSRPSRCPEATCSRGSRYGTHPTSRTGSAARPRPCGAS